MGKVLRVLTVLVALGLFSAGRMFASPNDTAEVQKVVEGFALAWNHHDMNAFGELFAPDAQFVNVTGFLMKGREDIQSHHAWSHGAIPQTAQIPGTRAENYGIFRHSTMKFDIADVRFLGKDVALVHVNWQLSGDARTSTPRGGVFLFVLNQGTDGWQIAAAQNTEVNRPLK